MILLQKVKFKKTEHLIAVMKALEAAGLTKTEARIYIALLELGSTPAGPLIKRVGMHRAAVYDAVDMLIAKGLVSYIQEGDKKHFQAEAPSRLLEYLQIKKQNLQKQESELKNALPQLELKRMLSKEQQEAAIYRGKKGLKSVFEDILKQKKPWRIFGATGKFKEMFPSYFIHFHARRAKSGIPMQIIYNEIIRKTRREQELKLCKIRYIAESYVTPSTTYIYSSKVTVIIWSVEPMAFVIRSNEVAESYSTFFRVLWSIARK